MIANLEIEISSNRGPERNLVAAILQRAWADLDNADRFIQADSYKWITSPDQGKPWTFFWACEALDLDPIALRKFVFEYSFVQRHQKLSPYRYKRKEL